MNTDLTHGKVFAIGAEGHTGSGLYSFPGRPRLRLWRIGPVVGRGSKW